MYTLKTPAFLRPASRPTSPSPGAASHPDTSNDRARPMSKLSFSNFKRTASPMTRPTTALVHDGSYMEVLSLRLSEAISKALAQSPGPGVPSELLAGRRPIPAGRGRALGELIASCVAKPHLANPLTNLASYHVAKLSLLAKIHTCTVQLSAPYIVPSQFWSRTFPASSCP